MSTCPHFNTENKILRSNEIGIGSMASSQVLTIYWCDHSCSPLTEFQAKNAIGVGGLLNCEGALTKCPIKQPTA